MKYQITVPQIKCSGCISLITLTLEDEFKVTNSSVENKIVEFESDLREEDIKLKLDKLFEELEGNQHKYHYTDLIVLNS